MFDWVGWLRNLDSALEHAIVLNWPFSGAPAVGATSRLAYDTSLGLWIVGGTNAGAPECYISYDLQTWSQRTPTNVSGAASVEGIATDQAGTVLLGCNDGTIRRTLDITAAAPAWTEPAPGGAATQALFWDDVSSFFQHMDGGRAISRSATGAAASWTRQALGLPVNFAGKTLKSGTTNGSDLAVVVATNHDECATSPDGIAWTARSMPLVGNWDDVCWQAGDSKFYAVDANVVTGSYASSSDGITWATVTPTTPAFVYTAHTLLKSTGNILVSYARDAGKFAIIWSDDSGDTWQVALETAGVASSLAVGLGSNNGMSLALAEVGPAVYGSLRVVD